MNNYCVVYRSGEQWFRTDPMTRAEADAKRVQLVQQGYHALYPVKYDLSVSIGLPEGYFPSRELLDAEGK